MLALDTNTLIVVTAITLILTASAILISWLINRQIAGANHWSLGYLFLASGILLQATQEYLNPLISIGLANHTIVAGGYLIWMGSRMFQGRQALPFHYFIILQLVLFMMLALLKLESSGLADRTILMSAILGALSLLIASELLRKNAQRNLSTTITGIVFVLLAIAFIARGLSVEILPKQGNMVTAGKHSHITYLFAIVFNIPIAFGFIIMLTERLENRLQKLANTDFLTGLHSRRAIVEAADRLISRSNRSHSSTSLVMMDLDHFKNINDTYGHQAGDALLSHFADTMRQCFRPDDLIGRIGGEEFIAILTNTGFADAMEAAERLRTTFEKEPTAFSGHQIDATVSIGIATTEHGAETFNQLFKDADKALYHAKGTGRNCIASILDSAIVPVNSTIS
ncbi:MAG TPA: GGDEF domain-containing protein [Ectothiorhodospiraceae bacterium]|nr:GGDEF domain-containing protein [Ectothiorhodospiraceae bacterium]